MSTRSRSNKKAQDERVFPIRVRYRVPEDGLGKRIDTIYSWLNQELVTDHYAVNSVCIPRQGDAVIYYFGSKTDAFRHFVLMQELGLELLHFDEKVMRLSLRR